MSRRATHFRKIANQLGITSASRLVATITIQKVDERHSPRSTHAKAGKDGSITRHKAVGRINFEGKLEPYPYKSSSLPMRTEKAARIAETIYRARSI